MQPRFVGGNPPDLVDNSGAQAIGFNTILDQLEDLTDVIDAPNLEGVTIRDTLYGGVLSPGTFDGKLAAINYAFTVYGVWYSGSLFEENGWTPPTTWAEALELGAAAAEQDKYLFCWGQEAATLLPDDVPSSRRSRRAATRCAWRWRTSRRAAGRTRPVQAAFDGLKAIIDAGYMQPGGGGTQFTQAQAQWSLDQDAIMYPSGSWIENEMKDQTAENFQMRGVPTWAVTADSVMPATALRATAGEPFIVPSQGANVAGGKELLRIMLSTEAATQLRPDEAGPDDRGRPRPRGRIRIDGAGVAVRDARGGGRGHLQPHLLRLLRHQPGRSFRSGTRSSPVTVGGRPHLAVCRRSPTGKREDDSITKISVE